MRVWVAAVVLSQGCATQQGDPEPLPPLSAPAALPTIVLVHSGGLDPVPDADPAWVRAERGDPMDLAALGQRLGAARLCEWVSAGGRAGAVALAALEHAPDALAERGRLCELLERFDPDSRQRGLEILERVLEPPITGEVLDLHANRRCREAVQRLSRAPLGESERDLVDAIGDDLGRN